MCLCACVCVEGNQGTLHRGVPGFGYQQWCAGNYLTMGSPGKTKPLREAFAEFCDVNTPMAASFKLPRRGGAL